MDSESKLTIIIEGAEAKWVFHHIADAVDFCDEPHKETVEKVTSSMGGVVETSDIRTSDWKEVKKAIKRLAAKVLRA